MERVRWFLGGFLTLVVALTFGGSWALAQSAQMAGPGNTDAELKTAIAHAGFAAKADALAQVTLHLHHVINCAVGPEGKAFYPAAGNPCQDQGSGFLPDLKAKKSEDAQYYQVQWAAWIANQAIVSNNLQEAKAAARIVSLVLEDAAKAQ